MERRSIAVEGVVQGVGFRPFVFGLASRLKLCGFVKNRAGGVLIEVEGEAECLDRFLSSSPQKVRHSRQIDRCRGNASRRAATATFESIRVRRTGCTGLRLSPTSPPATTAWRSCSIPRPPLPLSVSQLHQLRSAADDHHGLPTTAQRTTMASFPMCRRCRRNTTIRPTAAFMPSRPPARPAGRGCELLDAHGEPIETDDPLASFAAGIRGGSEPSRDWADSIWPATRATRSRWSLRQRKHRDEKPFAIMVRDVADGEAAIASRQRLSEVALLARRPIVLLHKRATARHCRAGLHRAIRAWASCCPTRRCIICCCEAVGRHAARDDQRQPLRRADRLSRMTMRSSG